MAYSRSSIYGLYNQYPNRNQMNSTIDPNAGFSMPKFNCSKLEYYPHVLNTLTFLFFIPIILE